MLFKKSPKMKMTYDCIYYVYKHIWTYDSIYYVYKHIFFLKQIRNLVLFENSVNDVVIIQALFKFKDLTIVNVCIYISSEADYVISGLII